MLGSCGCGTGVIGVSLMVTGETTAVVVRAERSAVVLSKRSSAEEDAVCFWNVGFLVVIVTVILLLPLLLPYC